MGFGAAPQPILRFDLTSALTPGASSPIIATTKPRYDAMRFKSILAAALFASANLASAQAEPVKIRMSFIVPVANWATMLFKTTGLAKHLDKSYTFEAIHFQGTPQLIDRKSTRLNSSHLGTSY